MFAFPIQGEIPAAPTLFFTINGASIKNPRAVCVIEQLRLSFADSENPKLVPHLASVAIMVFESEAAVAEAIASGVFDPSRAVAIWDATVNGRRFQPFSRSRSGTPFPSWSQGAIWGIAVGAGLLTGDAARVPGRARNIADQMRAWFGRQFEWITRTDHAYFPWGPTKRNERGVVNIILPSETPAILSRLNGGPDMVGEVNEKVREQLPKDSRISWIRVPGAVAHYPKGTMDRALKAVAAFEYACANMVSAPGVADQLLAGVDIPDNDPAIIEAYLFPRYGGARVTEWSVRRPDMHVNGAGLVSSENDEMPGGFFDLWHIDESYCVNADGWDYAFDWLLKDGSLAIVVSDEWSKVYVKSARWMAEKLCSMGRRVMVLTTPEVEELEIGENGVFYHGERLGMIWRQFPIFETKNGLAKLVLAAQNGWVKMIPEFAHFGNKTWYALFWDRQHEFRTLMSDDDFLMLQELVPQSRLILPGSVDTRFGRYEDLLSFTFAEQCRWVLKLTGASDRTARSLGVLVGAAQTPETWRAWIMERAHKREPFIVQRRFDTTVESVAVYNTRTKAPEFFPCKVLMRPWVLGGRHVSTSCAVTPHWTTKVHGMVDMAVVPVRCV